MLFYPPKTLILVFLALIADKKATDEPKAGRILRRQKQKDALDILPGVLRCTGLE